jgi:hypothetical protein
MKKIKKLPRRLSKLTVGEHTLTSIEIAARMHREIELVMGGDSSKRQRRRYPDETVIIVQGGDFLFDDIDEPYNPRLDRDGALLDGLLRRLIQEREP